MSHAEFLVVFVSIILGFNLSEYLQGVSRMVKGRREVKRYLPHSFWQVMILIMMVQWWWAFWLYHARTTEHMGGFLIALGIPTFYSLAISFLMPSDSDLKEHEGDMESFFKNSSGIMYVSLALIFVLYSETGLRWLGEEPWSGHILFRGLVSLSCLYAAFSAKRWADYIAMAVMSANMGYFYSIRFFETS